MCLAAWATVAKLRRASALPCRRIAAYRNNIGRAPAGIPRPSPNALPPPSPVRYGNDTSRCVPVMPRIPSRASASLHASRAIAPAPGPRSCLSPVWPPLPNAFWGEPMPAVCFCASGRYFRPFLGDLTVSGTVGRPGMLFCSPLSAQPAPLRRLQPLCCRLAAGVTLARLRSPCSQVVYLKLSRYGRQGGLGD